jgi:hypothetical protein
VLAHHFGRVIAPRLQGGDDGGVAPPAQRGRIAQAHGEVAQPALVADAADRTAFHPAVEFLFAPAEQFDHAGLAEAVAEKPYEGAPRANSSCK